MVLEDTLANSATLALKVSGVQLALKFARAAVMVLAEQILALASAITTLPLVTSVVQPIAKLAPLDTLVLAVIVVISVWISPLVVSIQQQLEITPRFAPSSLRLLLVVSSSVVILLFVLRRLKQVTSLKPPNSSRLLLSATYIFVLRMLQCLGKMLVSLTLFFNLATALLTFIAQKEAFG